MTDHLARTVALAAGLGFLLGLAVLFIGGMGERRRRSVAAGVALMVVGLVVGFIAGLHIVPRAA